jgi:hypothetical protein
MLSDSTNQNQTWVRTGKQILDLQIKEVPKLVEPIFLRSGIVSLAGSSDVGKSYLLLQLADAVINGRSTFIDFPLHVRHQAAIYVSTEDDDYSLSPRLMNLSKGQADTSAYQNLRVIYETTDLVTRLDGLLQEHPADIVIIDTFTDIYDGDMNQANRVRAFLQPFKQLATKHTTLVVFNHHCGKKNDERAPHKDNLLGSQGFESSMRAVAELRRDFKQPDVRHLCIVKANYLGEEYKNASYELRFTFEDGFKTTGDRVAFDRLTKEEKPKKKGVEAQEQIKQLLAQGYSVSQIHENLQGQGLTISRTTVGERCAELRPSVSISKSEITDGQKAA